MNLKNLLNQISYELIQGSDDINIDNVCWDSRRVSPNSLFICVKNRNIDRHNYAAEAIKKGVIALLVENDICNIPQNITVLKTKNTKKAMALISNKFYNEPSKKFNLIGITGTNGKTSVCCYIEKLLNNLGRITGIISTIDNRVGSTILKTEKLNPTTPDSLELQASFSEMISKEVTDVVMEVTSTALESYRVDMCDFDIGIFTNLTQDHLDEHGTMENYKKAKMKLFKQCKLGIINVDDAIANEIVDNSSCDIITYGIENPADFMAKNIKYNLNGVSFTLDFCGSETHINLNIPGKFNVYNILATIAACYFSGLPISTIANELPNIYGAKGRFEYIPNKNENLIIVDYAHSPDSLKNILKSVNELKPKRIILVFGCGGDRDKSKRHIMGEIAGNYADYCIITSDNPRNEIPIDIINDIEKGIKTTNCCYEKIEDRRLSIISALNLAKPNDAVIIAGKGHEKYQIIRNKIVHFDDCEIIKEYLGGNQK